MEGLAVETQAHCKAEEPSRQKPRRRRNHASEPKETHLRGTLPARFVPKCITRDCDGRLAIVQHLRRRVEELKRDVDCSSVAKSLLAEHAIFIAAQLETAQANAIDGICELDVGQFTQQINCLQGLLKSLYGPGLDRKTKSVTSLSDYIAERRAS